MKKFVSWSVACAALAAALAFSAGSAFAKGGGGTAVPTPPPTALSLSANMNIFTPTSSDQPVYVDLTALGDNRDAPVITMTSGPSGMILLSTSPADHPHGGINGYTLATYMWTPSRADIGLPFQATFKATTASGGSTTTNVNLGTVQDVAPTDVWGLNQISYPDHVEARWSPSALGNPLTYTLNACYMSVIVGTTVIQNYCETVANTAGFEALTIPVGPAVNAGNPSVPAKYYGLVLNGWSAVDGHLMGRASVSLP